MVIKTTEQTALYKKRDEKGIKRRFRALTLIPLFYFLLLRVWLNHRRVPVGKHPPLVCGLSLQVLQWFLDYEDPRSNLQLGCRLPLSSSLSEFVATPVMCLLMLMGLNVIGYCSKIAAVPFKLSNKAVYLLLPCMLSCDTYSINSSTMISNK